MEEKELGFDGLTNKSMSVVCFSDSDQNNRHLDKASVGSEPSSSEDTLSSSESDTDSDSPTKQKSKSKSQPAKKVRRVGYVGLVRQHIIFALCGKIEPFCLKYF